MTLETIFKHFRFVSRNDIMPMSSKRGGRDQLGDVYKDLGFTVGAEIGVRAGNYSKIICSKVPGIKYFCIDPWTQHNSVSQERQDAYLKAAKDNLKSFNVTFLKMTSMEALKHIKDRELDFVYIDGDHLFDYVVADIVFWAGKVKHGGIMAVHDYCNCYKGGVIKAVDAYTYCHKIDPWFVTGELQSTAFWVNP